MRIEKKEKSEGSKQPAPGVPGRVVAKRAIQRALTYIVISKPKRRSVAVGVSHFMYMSPASVARRRVAAARIDRYPLRILDSRSAALQP